MNTIIDLLLIAFICVNLIDISGFVNEANQTLGKWLKCSVRIPKPFSCSYCMTWWTGLGYLLFTGNLTLVYVSALLLVCFMTTTIAEIMYMVKDWITIVINKLH